jgi:hypothetical protein
VGKTNLSQSRRERGRNVTKAVQFLLGAVSIRETNVKNAGVSSSRGRERLRRHRAQDTENQRVRSIPAAEETDGKNRGVSLRADVRRGHGAGKKGTTAVRAGLGKGVAKTRVPSDGKNIRQRGIGNAVVSLSRGNEKTGLFPANVLSGRRVEKQAFRFAMISGVSPGVSPSDPGGVVKGRRP